MIGDMIFLYCLFTVMGLLGVVAYGWVEEESVSWISKHLAMVVLWPLIFVVLILNGIRELFEELL